MDLYNFIDTEWYWPDPYLALQIIVILKWWSLNSIKITHADIKYDIKSTVSDYYSISSIFTLYMRDVRLICSEKVWLISLSWFVRYVL